MRTEPGYLRLYATGELAERSRELQSMLASCRLCPRRCGVDRREKAGPCGADARPKVAAMNLHPWEEPPLSGSRGSGTVFFSGCALKCRFCQNYPISQLGVGRVITAGQLAEGMLSLQRRGAHNINLVTPTHQVPAFVQALLEAVPRGLRLPVVYNTGGYEALETLKLLENVVDVYLPDIKYAEEEAARFCSRRPDYVTRNRAALEEMWRQRGPLRVDGEGLAVEGVLVRHMVLPGGLAGTRDCMEFLRRRMGPRVWVSLMSQYFPAHEAPGLPPLDRKTTPEEYERAVDVLLELGLIRGFLQDDGAGEG